jgi:hypothetical protein
MPTAIRAMVGRYLNVVLNLGYVIEVHRYVPSSYLSELVSRSGVEWEMRRNGTV